VPHSPIQLPNLSRQPAHHVGAYMEVPRIGEVKRKTSYKARRDPNCPSSFLFLSNLLAHSSSTEGI